MTYGELKAQFEAILNRSDNTTALTTTFIDQALTRCQRDLRTPPQEVYSTTTASSFTSLPIPSDLIQVISVIVNGQRVEYGPMEEVIERNTGQGQPLYWTRKGSSIILSPNPGDGATIDLYYYGKFASFTNDNTETILSLIAPDLLIYGALSYACDYFIDDRAGAFESRYQQIKQSIQDQAYATEGAMAIMPSHFYEDYQ